MASAAVYLRGAARRGSQTSGCGRCGNCTFAGMHSSSLAAFCVSAMLKHPARDPAKEAKGAAGNEGGNKD